MATVFESISDGFYAAFFQPDPEKRKEVIEAWIKESTPVIQSAVENDLRAYLENILEATWTEKGWEARVKKFIGTTSSGVRKGDPPAFIDAYRLYLDVKIRRHESRDQDIVADTLTPEVRAKTNEAIEAAKTAVAKLEPPSPIAIREIDLHGNTVEEAIPIIENFLRECYRGNVRRVRVIHGKGIFVLQRAIREYLGTHKFVKSESISPADKDHGGEGATEAVLVDFSVNKLN
jgi:hypothetical protein